MPDDPISTKNTLDRAAIERLLAPYLPHSLYDGALSALERYLELLLLWNSRFNLTAIRTPEDIIQYHFGESLFCAILLPASIKTVLDYGSGAGFPGIPIQIARPDLKVSLAESQTKKSNFLREAVQSLGLTTEIIPARVESLPASRLFDAVALRAVDKMPIALKEAARRVHPSGYLVLMTTETQQSAITAALPKFDWHPGVLIPNSEQKIVLLGQRPAK